MNGIKTTILLLGVLLLSTFSALALDSRSVRAEVLNDSYAILYNAPLQSANMSRSNVNYYTRIKDDTLQTQGSILVMSDKPRLSISWNSAVAYYTTDYVFHMVVNADVKRGQETSKEHVYIYYLPSQGVTYVYGNNFWFRAQDR